MASSLKLGLSRFSDALRAGGTNGLNGEPLAYAIAPSILDR
ncbi:hypothetical protein [Coleofasciculus sp. H7-2]